MGEQSMKEPRIVCYNMPISMRLSEHSLASVVSAHGHELDGGDVFVFFNSKRNQCKIVWHDGTSFNSIDKRLEDGTFAPKAEIQITDSALQNLLSSGFLGSDELMAALHRATRGKIIHISAARSAKHLS